MDDHDLLIRIDERMERLESMLKEGQRTFRNHDARIRNIEQSQSKVMGIVITVGSMITVAVNGLLWLVGKVWK